MLFEIWIGEHHSHFDRGIAHLNDGRTIELDSFFHIATYGRDSVLIDDIEHIEEFNFPLRWFIKQNAIDFITYAATHLMFCFTTKESRIYASISTEY